MTPPFEVLAYRGREAGYVPIQVERPHSFGTATPWCALCRRPASKCTVYEDRGQVVLTAWCHGQSEAVAVSKWVLLAGQRVMFGVAFAAARVGRRA